MSMAGKVAIVTGGARGIGRAYAEALADAGAAVLIADGLEAEGVETAAAIKVKEQGRLIGPWMSPTELQRGDGQGRCR